MKQASAREPRNADFQNDLGTLYAQAEDWPTPKPIHRGNESRPGFAGAHLRLA